MFQPEEYPYIRMSSEEAKKLFIHQELPVSSSQILYPALSLICLLLLVQRIKNRRGRSALVLGRQTPMDSRKALPERPGGKDKEESQTAGAAVGHQQQSMSNSRDLSHQVAAPLPSACDILQPLSQRTQLPPSGHLASVLSRERCAGHPWPSLANSESPTESSPRPISTHTVSGGQANVGGSHRSLYQSEGEEANNSPNHEGLSPSTSDAPVMGMQSHSSLPPSTGTSTTSHRRSFIPDAPESNNVVQAKKRSETVQHLQDVDEHGVRTWKRLVVEYN